MRASEIRTYDLQNDHYHLNFAADDRSQIVAKSGFVSQLDTNHTTQTGWRAKLGGALNGPMVKLLGLLILWS